MFYEHDGMGAGGWIIMVMAMIAFWGLVAAAVVWLVRDARSRPPRQDDRGPASAAGAASATEILDRRLASGEIGVEEYERLRAAMRGDGPSAAAGAGG